MIQPRSFSSVRDAVEFCAFLRAEHFAIGVKETVDTLKSCRAVGAVDPEAMKLATRAVLTSSKEEWDRFDALFDLFWGLNGFGHNERVAESRSESLEKGKPGHEQSRSGQAWDAIATGIASESAETGEEESISGASARDRLRKTDFSKAEPSDVAELERVALRLLNQMSFRLSRRLKIAAQGQVDLRRTIRRSVGRGGDPVDLRYRGRKVRRPKLVVLLDVSGSMQLHSFFLLVLAYCLHKYFKQAESFVFSTRPVNVTGSLNSKNARDALSALSEVIAGWSGGTRIGETLHELNQDGADRLFSRDTVVIIGSDGLDTGEPDVLEQELMAVKRRARKIIWLTPLLGMENYQPLTRGISAALPLIDIFAPCHNLDSLLDLERLLSSGF
ncbi:MAG TPA: VWA domain-containing protein [Blastocatellia bacterium]